MTLQDFVSTSNNTLTDFGQNLLPTLLPLFAALLTLTIGLLTAYLLSLTVAEISKLLAFEKTLQKISSYQLLLGENKEFSLTSLLSRLVWWLAILVFLVLSLQIGGFSQSNRVFDSFSEFIPKLVAGSLSLLLGILFAYLAGVLIKVFGTLSKLPMTSLFSQVVVAVIIVFSILQALVAFGVSNEIIRLMVIGLIAAIALAVGLSSKEAFIDILKKFRNPKNLN